jgi:hypothetical protein
LEHWTLEIQKGHLGEQFSGVEHFLTPFGLENGGNKILWGTLALVDEFESAG